MSVERNKMDRQWLKNTFLRLFFGCYLLVVSCTAIALVIRTPVDNAIWIDSTEHAGIAYFLLDSPSSIERYDMDNEVFLSSISLPWTPTAFTVDDAGIYVASGVSIVRFDRDGTNKVSLMDVPFDITALVISGDFLYVSLGFQVLSIDKLSGIQIGQSDYFSTQGLSIAPSLGKIFTRSTSIIPSDIMQVALNSDGTFGEPIDSPYHGAYPSANKTFVFPGEGRVADTSGIIYNTSDLTYNNSLAGSFNDLVFSGNLPIVLRENTLYSYTNTLQETGQYLIAGATPKKIYVQNLSVYSFFLDVAQVTVSITPITAITAIIPAQPGSPVDPRGLAYIPDAIALGKDGIIYLLSKTNLSIFRWSIQNKTYLSTIPLSDAPSHMAYSSVTHRLYLAYSSGKINQIKLNSSFFELPFANSPQSPTGLSTAGEYIFINDDSGSWETHFIYSPNSILISQKDWNHYSEEYVWNATNRKMYFFSDYSSPNLLWEDIDADGVIGSKQSSPYHSSAGIQHPIRVSPDGSIVVLGSGHIYDAVTLSQIGALSNNVADATWLNNRLYALQEAGDESEVQIWNSNFELLKSVLVDGKAVGLFSNNKQLVSVTLVDNIPAFCLSPMDPTKIDTDGDTKPDDCDADNDNDGVYDHIDPFPLDPHESVDTDRDGIGNNADSDDDNDGVLDSVDNCSTGATEWVSSSTTDSDGDGCRDSDEEMYAVDYYPLHSGNSWIYLIDGVTSDTETVLNGTSIVNGIATKQIQTSSDGSISFSTNDANGLREHMAVLDEDDYIILTPPMKLMPSEINIGDEITSSVAASYTYPGYDPFPHDYVVTTKVLATEMVTVPLGTFPAIKIQRSIKITGDIFNATGVSTEWFVKHIGLVKEISVINGVTEVEELTAVSIDADGDGINVIDDNCPSVANPNQLDIDSDGQGNACDLDDDNDTVPDSADACPLGAINWVSNSRSDNDRDGCRDSSEDQDDDNDGVNDRLDLFPLNPNESADADRDGIGDNADTDDDNDGLTDIEEKRLGSNPHNKDSDNDGLDDGWEVDNNLDPTDGICPSWVCGGWGGWRHAIQPSLRR